MLGVSAAASEPTFRPWAACIALRRGRLTPTPNRVWLAEAEFRLEIWVEVRAAQALPLSSVPEGRLIGVLVVPTVIDRLKMFGSTSDTPARAWRGANFVRV